MADEFGGGPGWAQPAQPEQQLPPSLLQMAQGQAPAMEGDQFGGGPGFAPGGGGGGGAVPADTFGGWNLPTNNTPEGIQYAQRYANHLAWMAANPHMKNDNNSINTIAGFGADYTRANNIAYEPTGNGGSGFYMGSLADLVPGRAKPMEVPGVQGDVGRQLNKLPPAVRDAYGPAVVQHIISSGAPGFAYPGSAAYAGTVPVFEPNDSFRVNRDAWGRGFGLGSSDMPHPTRPRP